MTRKEFLTALSLARSPDFKPIPYFSPEMQVFYNCAHDRSRRSVTLLEVASLLHGHCCSFVGTWIHSEEAEIEGYSKRFDLVG